MFHAQKDESNNLGFNSIYEYELHCFDVTDSDPCNLSLFTTQALFAFANESFAANFRDRS